MPHRWSVLAGLAPPVVCPGMSSEFIRAWCPPHSQILFKSNLHIVLNISCKFHSCVKTLSHKTTEPSCGSFISLYNHVCGLWKFSATVSTGAREQEKAAQGRAHGGRRHPRSCWHSDRLPRGSLPHSALSNIAGKTFSVFNQFGPNLVHLLGVPEEDRPPILKKIRQL